MCWGMQDIIIVQSRFQIFTAPPEDENNDLHRSLEDFKSYKAEMNDLSWETHDWTEFSWCWRTEPRLQGTGKVYLVRKLFNNFSAISKLLQVDKISGHESNI